MNIFVFDIETIPDTNTGRKIYDLPTPLTDQEVGEAMFTKRREQTGGSDFLPLHLHRIVAISAVLKTKSHFKVWSLGDLQSSEKEIIQRFFAGIEKYTPTLVSWNGSTFDLPVLHYRALLHAVASPRYWEIGEEDNAFKWNNYLNRYHYRHTDLMDVLAAYQTRANAKLDEIAVMLGLPGKMGMSGNKVWDGYLNGEIEGIRNYCETDVLNTYLIYLRFRLIQGKLTEAEYQQQCDETIKHLQESKKPHLIQFAENIKNYREAIHQPPSIPD
ncbi:MAG: 3'-5' exonuclease [Gammaproteobacteria bacterium GWE2_42_36]|nr:MAG: 3'-5' exonuclease [Gammaproteobacteria bacterium GWE2_42_36]HCU05404.1 3'-5' exonuclease [Coxiellaceae bacterium]